MLGSEPWSPVFPGNCSLHGTQGGATLAPELVMVGGILGSLGIKWLMNTGLC